MIEETYYERHWFSAQEGFEPGQFSQDPQGHLGLPGVSRSALSASLKLDKSTVTKIVADLLQKEIIVETAGNIILLEMWRSLRVEFGTFLSIIKSDWDLCMIADMHAPLLHAMKLRDPNLAASQMRGHIEFFGSLVHRASEPQQGAREPELQLTTSAAI